MGLKYCCMPTINMLASLSRYKISSSHMAIRKIHRPSSVHRLRLILENYLIEFMNFLVDNEIINRMTYG